MRILRNLIIISVLLVSVTVQASGVDELVRIKQNYARMTATAFPRVKE